MINVTNDTKNAYRSDSSLKEVTLYFPNLDIEITTEQLDLESMELVESISEDDSIEFIGCNASQFKISIHGVEENLKGEEIEAKIQVGETDEIPLFHGYVDDVTVSANKSHKTLKCYDSLHKIAEKDVASFYVNLTFPITLKDFRDSLFAYIGITQEETTLPNDDIEIDKQYSPKTMKALEVVKAICQINGVFGIIDRSNIFRYRVPKKTDTATVDEAIAYQKNLQLQEYYVKPVDKLQIRQTEQDEGVEYGSGDNTYIIQGNMFTLGLESDVLELMAQNIYPNVSGFFYMPFKSNNNGFPWLECGDYVSYSIYDYDNSTVGNPVYKTVYFYILSRTLSGIQNLRDVYEAEGDEFQRVFITDLNSRIETILEQVNETINRLDEYALNYVVFLNPEKIVIHDHEEVSIWTASFAVQKPTQVMINMEYLLECETTVDQYGYHDLELKAQYYYDDHFVDSRQPTETYVDGKHILKMFYIINVTTAFEHKFEVRLIANGGQVTINIGQALNVMVGQKLVGDVWDGSLTFRQQIDISNMGIPSSMTMIGITENVSATTSTIIQRAMSETISLVNFGIPTAITTMGMTETVNLEVE